MNYGEILKKSWKIIWKHKILWLFGILAGFSVSGGSGGSGASSGVSSSSSAFSPPGAQQFMGSGAQQTLSNFGEFLSKIPLGVWAVIALGLVMALVILGFALSIFSLFAGTLGEAGVIAGASLADEADEDENPLNLKAVFERLKPHYWKAFLVKIGYGVLASILTLVFFIPLFLFISCTCCLGLFILIPVGWLFQTWLKFTLIAIIEEDLGVLDAIRRAWQLIIKNIIHVLVMFFILEILNIIIGLLLVVPVLFTIVPLAILLLIVGEKFAIAGLSLIVLLGLILVPVLILIAGVLKAFVFVSWTLTFRRLAVKNELESTLLLVEDEENKGDV